MFVGASLLYGASAAEDVQTEWRNGTDTLIGGERDEYGCLGAAGYQWDDSITDSFLY